MIIFPDILKTDCLRHAGEVLKTTRIHKIPKVDDWVYLTNQVQYLKSLEISTEAFYVFRRIQSENSWKWNKFKTITYLTLLKHFPAAWSLPQNTVYVASLPDFSHLFSDSDHFFRDPWVPLTFFPAVTLVVYHILPQHSVNAHTKPLSEKQSLSESCWGAYQT